MLHSLTSIVAVGIYSLVRIVKRLSNHVILPTFHHSYLILGIEDCILLNTNSDIAFLSSSVFSPSNVMEQSFTCQKQFIIMVET